MSKSDAGKGSLPRKQLVSNEERDLRWAYFSHELFITEKEFNKRVKEIRERTGKP